MAGRSFAQDIGVFVKKTGVAADMVLRKLALDGYRSLVLKSPVDKGRFRASWRVAINVVDSTSQPEPPVGGPQSPAVVAYVAAQAAAHAVNLAKFQALINTATFGSTISITNNLPYAEPLENGHSKQAPQGMLKITFAEITTSFAATVRAVEGGVAGPAVGGAS